MSTRYTLSGVALALSSSFAAADSPPFSLGDEIVVAATRSPQKLTDTLAAMVVVTRQDIESSGAIDLPGLLQGMVGVEIAQTGGFGGQTAIRLRGAESDHTLVLLDGLRIQSMTAGTTAIEHIPLDSIERIEIVRGNVSSVYGADAIGGVIRIFTRSGKGEMLPWLKVGAGNDDYRNLEAGMGGELPSGLSLSLSAGETRNGGFSAVKPYFVLNDLSGSFLPADVDKDGTRNTHFNVRAEQKISDRFKLGFTASQARARIEYDGSYTNFSRQRLSEYAFYAEGHPSVDWVSRLTIGRSQDQLDNSLDGAPVDSQRSTLNQAAWENTLAVSGQIVRFGIDTQNQLLDSNQTYTSTHRSSVSPYAGFNYSRGAHELDMSARDDRYSDFGNHVTGRIAYGYALAPEWKLFGSLANAFKAPTFNELYLPAAWGGNPNLDPEHSRSAELGLNFSGRGQYLQATLFASRTRDLIAYVSTINVNIGKAHNHGLEVSWQGTVAGLTGHAALTLQNPEDASTGQALLRRAQHFGSAGLSDRIGRFGWQADVVASGPHPDVHVTDFTRVTVPGYASLNLTGDYAVTQDWKLRASLINALDADYSLVHGYATPGRQFRLELAYIPR